MPTTPRPPGGVRRGLQAVAAACTLGLILAGLPALLALTIGNPIGSWDDLLAGDTSDTVVIDVLAAVAWLAWGQFTAITLIEATRTAIRPARARQPRSPRAGGVLGTQQQFARALITAAFLIGPTAAPAISPATATTAAATAPIDIITTIAAPATATALPPAHAVDPTAATRTTMYVITDDGPGTLWDLARTFLGRGERWPEIWALNDGRRQADGTVMTNPGLLRTGWSVLIPADDKATGKPAPVVTVRAGDTLSSVAREHGHHDWHPLWEANRGSRQPDGDTLTDPDHIEPGWKLRIPTPETTDRPHPSETTPPPDSSNPPPAPPPVELSIDADATPPADPTPAFTAPEKTEEPEHAPNHQDQGEGATFDGGWIGLPLAAALAAAAAMAWRQRRRRYVPGPLTPEELEDRDLRPMPGPITAARRAVRHQAPELLNPPAEEPTVAEYAAAGYAHRLPPPGPNGTDLAGLSHLVTDSGLGLTGPGAEAAARALLVATLSTGSTADPEAKGHVIIPADTLTTLLGVHAVDLGPIPRLTVTPSLGDALAAIEQMLIERRRTLDEHDAADLDRLRADNAYYPLVPPVLLISEAPDAAYRGRLITGFRLGLPLRISGVLLGPWNRGDTLNLDNDGRPRNLDPGVQEVAARRISVLDVPTTVQLLHVLRETHTGEAPPAPEHDPLATPPAQQAHTAGHRPATKDSAGTDGKTAAGATSKRVTVRVLGPPQILDQDGRPVPGLRRNATQLLLYLVVHRTGADLSAVMEAIWPTATVRRAQERLSTEVANLRRTIRTAANDPSAQPVINTGSRYHLNPDLLDIDAWTLSDALQEAAASTDPDTRVRALRRAVDAHTGTFGDAHDDADWLEPHREHYRRHGIRARIHLADHLAPTDPPQAADLAEAAADLDPSNEAVARRAMEILALVGRTQSIRARVQRLTQALEELDEEPSPETTALAAELQETTSRREADGSAEDDPR